MRASTLRVLPQPGQYSPVSRWNGQDGRTPESQSTGLRRQNASPASANGAAIYRHFQKADRLPFREGGWFSRAIPPFAGTAGIQEQYTGSRGGCQTAGFVRKCGVPAGTH